MSSVDGCVVCFLGIGARGSTVPLFYPCGPWWKDEMSKMEKSIPTYDFAADEQFGPVYSEIINNKASYSSLKN